MCNNLCIFFNVKIASNIYTCINIDMIMLYIEFSVCVSRLKLITVMFTVIEIILYAYV